MTSRSSIPVYRRKGRVVLLSYSHEDVAVAARLHQFLKVEGISVLVDSESMTAGERIQDFIARAIQQADVVVSLVSRRSLLSAWVAMETIQSLQRNNFVEGRRFIACYLDDAFFAPECRLNYTQQIDERLQRIEELIPEYAARRIDTIDLNEEKTRLYDLRNGLWLILAALKDSLCLDVQDDRFEESGKRLIAAIRAEVVNAKRSQRRTAQKTRCRPQKRAEIGRECAPRRWHPRRPHARAVTGVRTSLPTCLASDSLSPSTALVTCSRISPTATSKLDGPVTSDCLLDAPRNRSVSILTSPAVSMASTILACHRFPS